MTHFSSFVVLALFVATSANSQGPTNEKAKWEAEWRVERSFLKRQFNEAGFVPIEEIDAGERHVRRLSLSDPYAMLPIPGVEFEKRRDGTVTMRFQYQGYRTDPLTLEAAAWDRIVAGDSTMFAIPKEGSSFASATLCHDWTAYVQAPGNRVGSWWGCRDGAGPKRAYVDVMLKTALATRPDCKVGNDPRWSFKECFAEKEAFDDAKLNAAYSELLGELTDAPGSDLLATARTAVRAPGLTVGSPAWREAREAVRDVLRAQSLRRETLQKLVELDHRTSDVSPVDKLKLQRAIRGWSQSIKDQDYNHVELLRSLAWAGQ